MIGKSLQKLLDEKDINVNELSKMINVSNQTLYSIIKRDNMKIDFEILLKICKALNVSVDYFYSDYIDDKITTLTPKQQELYNTLIKFDDDKINLAIRILRSLLDEND